MSNDFASSIEALFSKMETFISTKTVVGEPVISGDVILIPLVDVSFGVGAGAFEKPGETKASSNGGGALGAKITPSAVLVIINGTVQLVNVKSQDSINKLIDLVPSVLSKFNLSSIFGKDKKDDKPENKDVGLAETRF